MVLLDSRGGERGGGGGLRIIYGSALASLVRIEEKTRNFFVTMWGVGGAREIQDMFTIGMLKKIIKHHCKCIIST
jgi:hypothetical protein